MPPLVLGSPLLQTNLSPNQDFADPLIPHTQEGWGCNDALLSFPESWDGMVWELQIQKWETSSWILNICSPRSLLLGSDIPIFSDGSFSLPQAYRRFARMNVCSFNSCPSRSSCPSRNLFHQAFWNPERGEQHS